MIVNTWVKFKELTFKCTNHHFDELILMQSSYNRVHQEFLGLSDAATREGLMQRKVEDCKNIIEKIAT